MSSDAGALAIIIPAAVVLARLAAPLLIPLHPLPAILAALLLDAVDQTIFQATLGGELEGYQSYDKALDVYYLAIAYLSTLRNWDRGPAFVVGRFLWYYRLVGVLLFESTGLRPLLFIFPNTFEYFFIAIEAVKLSWNPFRLAARSVIGLAAVIWIGIKLPQEWWIHIAQRDVTDTIKELLFGVPPSASWTDAIANRPLVAVAMMGSVVALVALAFYARRWLPARDWPATTSADVQGDHLGWPRPAPPAVPTAAFGWAFFEKVVLISLVTGIFASMLIGELPMRQIVIGVALIIAVSTLASQQLARRGLGWSSLITEFVVMTVVNGSIGLVLGALLGGATPDSALVYVFLIGLLSLIVVLYDRYSAIGRRRWAPPAG